MYLAAKHRSLNLQECYVESTKARRELFAEEEGEEEPLFTADQSEAPISAWYEVFQTAEDIVLDGAAIITDFYRMWDEPFSDDFAQVRFHRLYG